MRWRWRKSRKRVDRGETWESFEFERKAEEDIDERGFGLELELEVEVEVEVEEMKRGSGVRRASIEVEAGQVTNWRRRREPGRRGERGG